MLFRCLDCQSPLKLCTRQEFVTYQQIAPDGTISSPTSGEHSFTTYIVICPTCQAEFAPNLVITDDKPVKILDLKRLSCPKNSRLFFGQKD